MNALSVTIWNFRNAGVDARVSESSLTVGDARLDVELDRAIDVDFRDRLGHAELNWFLNFFAGDPSPGSSSGPAGNG